MLKSYNPKLALLSVAGAALLTACATATPYQAAAKAGASGYAQTQTQNDRFTVSFSGNSLTNQETVETYLLYRAAELAVENGYDYFTLADKDTQAKTRIVSTGPGYGFSDPFYPGFACAYDFYSPRLGWRSRYSPYRRGARSRGMFPSSFYGGFGSPFYDPFYDDFNYREVTKFKAKADIILARGVKPAGDNVFDARQVMSNLSSKLVYPEAES